MSEYFRYIPNLYYRLDKGRNNSGEQIDDVHQKLITDITMRTRLRKFVKDDLINYYPYIVPDGQRPDNIANEYYGSIKYTWIVFLSNNIFDPQFEWPMSSEALRKFIISKYGSLDNSIKTIHHYEEIIQPHSEADGDNPEILERTIEVDEKEYRRLVQLGTDRGKLVTNYQYEQDLNDSKKNIQLIENIYVEDILTNARELFTTGF
tara:strand:- start:313 stop:930 length:618 start_codon:yes stop_codon:yes gene_type:complete